MTRNDTASHSLTSSKNPQKESWWLRQKQNSWNLPHTLPTSFPCCQDLLATYPTSRRWCLTGPERTKTATSCFSLRFTLTLRKEWEHPFYFSVHCKQNPCLFVHKIDNRSSASLCVCMFCPYYYFFALEAWQLLASRFFFFNKINRDVILHFKCSLASTFWSY